MATSPSAIEEIDVQALPLSRRTSAGCHAEPNTAAAAREEDSKQSNLGDKHKSSSSDENVTVETTKVAAFRGGKPSFISGKKSKLSISYSFCSGTCARPASVSRPDCKGLNP